MHTCIIVRVFAIVRVIERVPRHVLENITIGELFNKSDCLISLYVFLKLIISFSLYDKFATFSRILRSFLA